MKICLYSPYIPKHIGGGEKYMFDVAQVLAKKHQVMIAVPRQYEGDVSIISKYQRFLDESLENISFVSSPLGSDASPLEKIWWTKQFDLIYFLTDGSQFFSLASQNIMHIQFPLRLDKSSLIERLKLRNWPVRNTNSFFTKQIVEKSWPINITTVHHPLIEAEQISQQLSAVKKEKIILNVGRFFKQLHSKRQDVLIDVFRQLRKEHPKQLEGWKLVLIGSVEDQAYLSHIKRKKRSLPVEFYHDLPREELLNWYGRARIYWHATGYGVDELKHPEKVEHFGISTVEAMAAGCVPLVVYKGGQKEVLGPDLNEYGWQTIDECVAKTFKTIVSPPPTQQFTDQARSFGRARFEKQLWQMIKER